MNHLRKIEFVRKQNEELLLKINELQGKLDQALQEKEDQKKQFDSLMVDLRKIRKRWKESIDDLEKKNQEYEKLIEALYEARGVMKSMNFKIPWYKKISLKRIK